MADQPLSPPTPSKTWRLVVVWLVIGTLGFLAVQAWQAHQSRSRFAFDQGAITLKRSPDGHYHWPGKVNGVPVVFMVDTGATRTALPAALADRANVSLNGKSRTGTAAGDVVVDNGTATVELEGGVVAQQLSVGVLSKLDTPLLGMDVLGRLRLTQQDGALRIESPQNSR
jgi:aspartyl protease family protein